MNKQQEELCGDPVSSNIFVPFAHSLRWEIPEKGPGLWSRSSALCNDSRLREVGATKLFSPSLYTMRDASTDFQSTAANSIPEESFTPNEPSPFFSLA